jgi:RNA polymerase sigma-70 factor (ECF subfamily)
MKNPEFKSDSFLVLDFQSGNKQALVLLVERWHKTLCKKAFWVLKDTDLSKDIAQECWKIVILNINDLKDPNSFGGWISRIVYRKSLDVLLSNKKTEKIKEAYKYQQVIKTEDDDFTEAIEKYLLKAIKSLPMNQQIVIQLFYVESYSLKEISTLLDLSTGTIKSRLFNARESLKHTLKYRNHEK